MKKNMETQDKTWGKNTVIHNSEYSIVCFAEIDPGGFCSVHIHENRHNWFQVAEGSVTIYMWGHTDQDAEATPLEYELTPDSDPYCIEARIPHQFYSEKGCKLVEVYTPASDNPINFDDIIRLRLTL